MAGAAVLTAVRAAAMARMATARAAVAMTMSMAGMAAAKAAGTYNIQQSAKSGSNDDSNDAWTMPRWRQTSTGTGKVRAMR